MSGSKASNLRVTRMRNFGLEEMEKRLSIWIEDQAQRHIPLSQMIIMEKAKSIFLHIQQEEGDFSETFSASRGWFDRFKKRQHLHSIRITGEAASADIQAAKEFPTKLRQIIEEGKYPPQLVFNVDETGLFWKRMPNRTFVSQEEKRVPGFKAAKERLTLLLGGNAKGDIKLKPLLVYHSETPRAMRGFSKTDLPVIWTSNKKAWVTIEVFKNWFVNNFSPYVKRYCEHHKLEPKALLLLDNAPGHPDQLETLETCIPVKVVFLPPNTTSVIQPMDQGVIANFKANYLRRTFRQLVESTNRKDQPSISEFWKNYNVMNAIDNIKVV